MPIQLPNWQRLSFDEINPIFNGMAKGQGLAQNFLQFPQQLQKAMQENYFNSIRNKYADQMAQQGLTKEQNYNKYYIPDIQSKIGLRGAETNKMNTMTPLEREKMESENEILKDFGRKMANEKYIKAVLENEYIPMEKKAEIALKGGQTNLANTEANMNNFRISNPQYISPEGRLISEALKEHPKNQENNIHIESNQQQNGFNPGLYNPQAFAFNPPSLPSPTGNQQLDNLYNKKFGISPVIQKQLDLSSKQAEKYQVENIERNKEFSHDATFANQASIDSNKFLDALDRVNDIETGKVGGNLPALSDAAQEMDAASNNVAASATQLFKEGNAIHKSDIELQQLSKANRQQNKDVSFDLAHGVIAKTDRMKERQQFYSRGTQLGLRSELLDSLWNKYETDRPYIDSITKMPNDAYKGTWQDYLKPNAVNAFLEGKDYTPSNQKILNGMNWTRDNLSDVKKWAYKNRLDPKKWEKKDLYRLAKNEGITLSQLKMELMSRGVFKNAD